MDFIHSIKFKFTVWYLLILALLLVCLSMGIYAYLSRSLYRSLDNALVLRTEQLRNVGNILETMTQGSFEEKIGEVVVFFYERDGEVYALSRRDVDVTLDKKLVTSSIDGRSDFQTVMVDAVGEMRFYIVPFRAERPVMMRSRPMMPVFSVQSAALAVGRSTEEIDHALDGLVKTLLMSVPLALVVAGAGGIFLARRALKPVEQIADTAREIGETDLSRRIAVNTRDELGRLASTLNQMIERLERAFKRQREFTGDASHELRTPLSVIQAESTLALQKARSPDEYRASLESIARETEHMSRIIEQLLVLARADSGMDSIAFVKTDLNELLRDVSEDCALLSRQKGLEMEADLKDSLIVRGDRGLLRRLFLNLVDNAVRYTPKGGKVSLESVARDHMAVVSIRDTGIGIPAEHLPYVFERFYRVDKARSRSEGGSGLGLAICKQIADLHGGQIQVESREGEGSVFRVLLPLSA